LTGLLDMKVRFLIDKDLNCKKKRLKIKNKINKIKKRNGSDGSMIVFFWWIDGCTVMPTFSKLQIRHQNN